MPPKRRKLHLSKGDEMMLANLSTSSGKGFDCESAKLQVRNEPLPGPGLSVTTQDPVALTAPAQHQSVSTSPEATPRMQLVPVFIMIPAPPAVSEDAFSHPSFIDGTNALCDVDDLFVDVTASMRTLHLENQRVAALSSYCNHSNVQLIAGALDTLRIARDSQVALSQAINQTIAQLGPRFRLKAHKNLEAIGYNPDMTTIVTEQIGIKPDPNQLPQAEQFHSERQSSEFPPRADSPTRA